MAASEATVTAAQSVLRLHPYRAADEGVGWECGCGEHFANYGLWQAHLAVAAADAAVDADRASIQAETLREAAKDIQALHPGETKNSVNWLRDRADRIEAQL